MNAHREPPERAQELCDRLHRDVELRAAHDEFDTYAWAAANSLAALLGEDVPIHAWIEPTDAGRIELGGTVRVLTLHHLLTADYGRGKQVLAQIEPLNTPLST